MSQITVTRTKSVDAVQVGPHEISFVRDIPFFVDSRSGRHSPIQLTRMQVFVLRRVRWSADCMSFRSHVTPPGDAGMEVNSRGLPPSRRLQYPDNVRDRDDHPIGNFQGRPRGGSGPFMR